jgi:hypothetical protein
MSLSGPMGSDGTAWGDADSYAGEDSWQESEHPEHTHDPHEVTVQMDGVGRQLEDWLVQQAKGAPSAQDASDGPVFVDETGRRSRRYRRIGMAVGMACAVYAVVILATLLSGNSSAPWLPELGQKQEDGPAGKVDTPPLPADSAGPTGSVSPSPGVTPSAGGTVTNSPGAGTSKDPSASASKTGESPDPKPSVTNTKPDTPKPTPPSPRTRLRSHPTPSRARPPPSTPRRRRLSMRFLLPMLLLVALLAMLMLRGFVHSEILADHRIRPEAATDKVPEKILDGGPVIDTRSGRPPAWTCRTTTSS